MSKEARRIQFRFYDVMQFFIDDERVAACALCEFIDKTISPETVYRDLLSCRWEKWIDQLERVTDEVSHTALKNFCLDKQAMLDCMGGDFWGCGDNALLEKAAWKLVPSDKFESEEDENELDDSL